MWGKKAGPDAPKGTCQGRGNSKSGEQSASTLPQWRWCDFTLAACQAPERLSWQNEAIQGQGSPVELPWEMFTRNTDNNGDQANDMPDWKHALAGTPSLLEHTVSPRFQRTCELVRGGVGHAPDVRENSPQSPVFQTKGCTRCVCDSCNCPVSVAKAVFHALLEILDRTFQKINRSSQCLHTHRMKMCMDRSEGAKGCNLEGKDWSPPAPCYEKYRDSFWRRSNVSRSEK